MNQKEYTNKLSQLFDISHANSEQLIKTDEDRQFLKLQQQSRMGSIGSVDKKLMVKEKRVAKRQKQFIRDVDNAAKDAVSKIVYRGRSGLSSTAESAADQQLDSATHLTTSSVCHDSNEDDKSDEEFLVQSACSSKTNSTTQRRYRRDIISPKVAAVLDRTNTSIRKSTMILASAFNEAGVPISETIFSKSTMHRHRQRRRQQAADLIKENYVPSKSIVHWDGKLLTDVTGVVNVDRLPVLLSSLVDGTTKLLGVPKLASGSGRAAADAVHEHIKSWKCESMVIGMCFDTTASNTGKLNGACTLLEKAMGHNLLWMACRHHMFEVLLADVFNVCLGPSTGPEILFFKRFLEKWTEMNHTPEARSTPLIIVSDAIKAFIKCQLEVRHSRDDYLEFLLLAAQMVGLQVDVAIRKPGALHRARWMAKAIYALKIELLFTVNKTIFNLTARELQGIQRLNRFIIRVYLQSWFSCRLTADAPVNDILLIQRLYDYDDAVLGSTGLKMMLRHSWYMSPELATLALFSSLLSDKEKTDLVRTIQADRGPHLMKTLPQSFDNLRASKTFFETSNIDASFLDVPVENWSDTPSFQVAAVFVRNLVCINDSAER